MPSSSRLSVHEHPQLFEATSGCRRADPLPPGFIHSKVVQGLRIVLAELGADADTLITATGLDPALFDGGRTLVPFTAVGRLMALGAERTRCPHLGLLVGQRTTLGSLDLLGLQMRSSHTVGDALRALEAHLSLYNRGAAVGLGIYDDIAVLNYAPLEPEAEGAALHMERALAKATNLLRALCGADWAPSEVLLPHSAPADATPYKAFFRAPVRFDQEEAVLVFPTQLLKHRVATAEPAVLRRVEERMRRLKAAQTTSLSDEVLRYLRTAVTRQRCKAERVARLRQVTRRTLSRRLQAEGTSFRRLANEAQFRVARQLLADTSMSMAQVSAVLDFSEPSAFTHAFRRWSGVTPSAWRKVNALGTEVTRLDTGPQTPRGMPDAGPHCGWYLCPSHSREQ